jgi:hypothetical protein
MKHLNKENEKKTKVNFVNSGERKFNKLKTCTPIEFKYI